MLSNGGSDETKVIVRQLDFSTSQTTIEGYFSQYGHVREIIMKYNENGRSKGFCFVVFQDKQVMDEVVKGEHFIDGTKVQVKRVGDTAGNPNATTKMFCGGLPHALTEDDLREYFIQYGEIKSFEFIFDRGTQVRKHFCFVVFEDAGSVEKIVSGKLPPGSVIHHVGKYRVECKKKFDDNHPVQRRVKQESSQKRAEREEEGGWDTGYGRSAAPAHEAYPVHTAPVRRGRGAPRGRGGPPAARGYSTYPGYSNAGYTDPYAAGYDYTDPYAAEESYAADPYAGYTAPVSGYSSYPGYESEYGASQPAGGGPMKAPRGARGAARGAYRPY